MNISPIGFKSNPYSTQKAQNSVSKNNSNPTFGVRLDMSVLDWILPRVEELSPRVKAIAKKLLGEIAERLKDDGFTIVLDEFRDKQVDRYVPFDYSIPYYMGAQKGAFYHQKHLITEGGGGGAFTLKKGTRRNI